MSTLFFLGENRERTAQQLNSWRASPKTFFIGSVNHQEEKRRYLSLAQPSAFSLRSPALCVYDQSERLYLWHQLTSSKQGPWSIR